MNYIVHIVLKGTVSFNNWETEIIYLVSIKVIETQMEVWENGKIYAVGTWADRQAFLYLDENKENMFTISFRENCDGLNTLIKM